MSESTATPEKGLFRSFPRSFWLVNLMELFERGAYYGMNSVLAVYLTQQDGGGLGFAKANVGFLLGLVYAITYILPIIGGALADRYGYRRMLLIAFSLISTGYMATAFVTDYWMVFLTLGIMAVGSGLFKPIISGTIARTTNEKTSGFGFGVYYWMINVGALIAPLVIYYLRGISWSYVFIFSSAATALMFIPTLFFYEDPDKPKNTKNIKEVLHGAVTVLSDSRFMLMVFVYSLFWILYFQNFGTVLWYLRDFIDPTPINNFFASMGFNYSFRPEHVTVINAGTIVLLQVFISWLTKKSKPLPTMIVGMFIGSCGFLFLALSSNIWVFIAGIAIFSIGEMTCHPKYVSYIGLIAPSDKKAIYMGYAFIYGVIGSLVGSNVGGELYDQILTPISSGCVTTGVSTTLRNFWLMFAFLGFVSMSGLFMFNRYFGKDTKHTRAKARRVMVGAYSLFIIIGFAFILLRVWSVFTPASAKSPHIPISVAFNASGTSLYSTGWDNSIATWNVENGTKTRENKACGSNPKWSTESETKDNHIICSDIAGTIEEWNLASGKVISKLNNKYKNIWAVSKSLKGEIIAVEGMDGGIKIWDLKKNRIIKTLKGRVSTVISAMIHSRKQLVVTGSNDGVVRVWDMNSGKIKNSLIGHSGPINSVAFNLDGTMVVSAGDDGLVKIWNLSTNKASATFAPKNENNNEILSVSIDPKSQVVAMGNSNESISLWSLKTKKEIRTLKTSSAGQGGIALALKSSAKTFFQAFILISIGFLGLHASRKKKKLKAKK
jgi:proton-dependent oligopeptide transporter, POT family